MKVVKNLNVIICDKNFTKQIEVNLSGYSFYINSKTFFRDAFGVRLGSIEGELEPFEILFGKEIHIIFATPEEVEKFVSWLKENNKEAEESYYNRLD
jgi:hypothetical protein